MFSLVVSTQVWGWNLSGCDTDFAELRARAASSYRMPWLPEVSLKPGPELADAINPIGHLVTPDSLVIENPALLQSYRSAVDYYARHREQIEANLAKHPEADLIRRDLDLLIANPQPRSITAQQFWKSLQALTAGVEVDPLAYDTYEMRWLNDLMNAGIMPLPVFQNEPLTQKEILLYQAAMVAPIQVIDKGRIADTRPMTPVEFLKHDTAHAWRLDDGGDYRSPGVLAEVNALDYPWMKETDHAQKLQALRQQRYAFLNEFLEKMPGVEATDREYVVPMLFEIFHEGFEFAPYYYNTARTLPTDLRVLARYLRSVSYNLNDDFPRKMQQSGVPFASAQRIFKVLSEIPDYPNR